MEKKMPEALLKMTARFYNIWVTFWRTKQKTPEALLKMTARLKNRGHCLEKQNAGGLTEDDCQV